MFLYFNAVTLIKHYCASPGHKLYPLNYFHSIKILAMLPHEQHKASSEYFLFWSPMHAQFYFHCRVVTWQSMIPIGLQPIHNDWMQTVAHRQDSTEKIFKDRLCRAKQTTHSRSYWSMQRWIDDLGRGAGYKNVGDTLVLKGRSETEETFLVIQ